MKSFHPPGADTDRVAKLLAKMAGSLRRDDALFTVVDLSFDMVPGEEVEVEMTFRFYGSGLEELLGQE